MTAPLGAPGPVIGLDHLSAGLWRFDPYALSSHKIITAPAWMLVGRVGRGKSALVNTYLSRICARCDRMLMILDPKGEYELLAKALGLARIVLSPGGDNPIDPLAQIKSANPGAHQRLAALLANLAEIALHRPPDEIERAALSMLAQISDPNAGLPGVHERLWSPSGELAAKLSRTQAQAKEELRRVHLALDELVNGSLAGILNGTGPAVIGPDGPGIVIDMSACLDSEFLPAAMAGVGALLAEILLVPGRRRILVIDEAWAPLRNPATVAWLAGVVKLSRTYGVEVGLITHKPADLVAQSEMGSIAAKQVKAMMADIENFILYAQPGDDEDGSRSVRRLFGLTESEEVLVKALPKGRGLWLVGRHRAVVDHYLSRADHALTYTDDAMEFVR